MTFHNSHLYARLQFSCSRNIFKSLEPPFRAAGIQYESGKCGSFAQEIWVITQIATETISSPCSVANLLRNVVLSNQQFLNFIIIPVSCTLFVIMLPPFLNLRSDRSAPTCQGCVTLYLCRPLRSSAPNVNFNSTSVKTSGLSQTHHALQDAGVFGTGGALGWWLMPTHTHRPP